MLRPLRETGVGKKLAPTFRRALEAAANDAGASHTDEVAQQAIEEASRVRSQIQHELIDHVSAQSRENDGLAERVATLDASLRASEAAREFEASSRASEVAQMREQLEDERRRSRPTERPTGVGRSVACSRRR